MEPVEVMPAIARSWNRCVHDFGLDPIRDEPLVVLESRQLKARQEKLARLRAIAQGEMATLYQQLAGSGFSVLLTDSDGVVLDLLGDPSFTDTATECGMMEGVVWSERYQGTNGMGTCAIEQRPILIHHNEHFLTRNVGLTCSAAPIFDHEGSLLAVLDASSFSHMAQQHTLVLVNMSAQMIENRVFLCRFRDHYALRFHSRPEFIGTLWEGALALDEDGRILAANRSALFQLGYKKPADLLGLRVADLFNTGMAELLGKKNQGWLNPVPLYEARQGNRFFGLIRPPETQTSAAPAAAAPASARRAQPSPAAPGGHKVIGLDELQFGDQAMEYNVRCARRVLGKDIPMLLSGETGTGKEVFALAVHAEQAGEGRPFVAVNCASIPESLIESELFGYKSGAFTGATREGRRGKILQANGGTLFLDEIGDMPIMLQARLLRVLEEREVVPLGSEIPVKVDIKLISATHRNLKELVAEGRFREDLYYRLQGITLDLPALRERQDKCALIHHILSLECEGGEEVELSEGALRKLEEYAWPGNIRQLRNVLRTTLALREGREITICDLPGEVSNQAHSSHVRAHAVEASLGALESAERDAILQSLEKCRWNVTVAAKQLKVSRNTLYRKMKNLNIRSTEEE
ncbi:MAG: sigma-54-dependent Fis family transcriptional regulator [Gallionellaceae bacterium]|nr:sigma-54-dependent Fis family transcriptional regulator [Gallionellaceae bacterium]